jgi:TetR/AcrR family transcriptional repressor of nem operon
VYTLGVNLKHDKEKALKTGIDLLRLKGYNKIGVAEICKATGMPKGVFYNTFGSKEDFLIESVIAYGVSSRKAYQKFIADTDGGERAIDRLRSLYKKILVAHARMNYRGCLVCNTMAELGAENPILREVTTKQLNLNLKVIEPVVKQAQKDGDITNATSAKKITELLHLTLVGVSIRAKGLQDVTEGQETMKLLINSLSP